MYTGGLSQTLLRQEPKNGAVVLVGNFIQYTSGNLMCVRLSWTKINTLRIDSYLGKDHPYCLLYCLPFGTLRGTSNGFFSLMLSDTKKLKLYRLGGGRRRRQR